MRVKRQKLMCVCCGEYFFVAGDVKHFEDKMCAACNIELSEMDGPEFFLFISDIEKVLEREASLRYDDIPYVTVEELISVMDH